jgi:hypothetical protein
VFEEIEIQFYHPVLKIGLQDIRNAWMITDKPFKLTTALHRGRLSFRIPGSGKRISYLTLKKGLIKKRIIIRQPVYLLPF